MCRKVLSVESGWTIPDREEIPEMPDRAMAGSLLPDRTRWRLPRLR